MCVFHTGAYRAQVLQVTRTLVQTKGKRWLLGPQPYSRHFTGARCGSCGADSWVTSPSVPFYRWRPEFGEMKWSAHGYQVNLHVPSGSLSKYNLNLYNSIRETHRHNIEQKKPDPGIHTVGFCGIPSHNVLKQVK